MVRKIKILLLNIYGALGFLGIGCGAGADDPTTRTGEHYSEEQEVHGSSLPPFELTCESNSFSYKYCPSPTPIEQVRLVRNLSQWACEQGHTWGYDANGIWVKEGCHGVFVVTPTSPPPSTEPRSVHVTCSSSRYRFATCDTGLRIESVQLVHRHSRSDCTLGRSWGHDGYSLWVNHGCRATFLVQGYQR